VVGLHSFLQVNLDSKEREPEGGIGIQAEIKPARDLACSDSMWT
jgi:hypothetical protein